MIKIALAGGTGDLGSEIIDVLLATHKHELVVLSRGASARRQSAPGTTLVTVDYGNVEQLVGALEGVHTLLSFISEGEDPSSPWQRNLIDAAVQAGVKRFAPSEWSTSKMDYMDWYAYKATTREYLAEINKDKKVLEYSLFQPGFFQNYFTFPHTSTKYLHLMALPFSFETRRFLVVEGSEDTVINFVTVQDTARLVAAAVDYDGEWPVNGGIRGTVISIRDLLALGEKIRGATFDVTRLKEEDIMAGEWKAPWTPVMDHPGIPKEEVEVGSKFIAGRILVGQKHGAYVIGDEWNRAIPEFKATNLEEFLTKAWEGKP